jgi:hypothetical protein
MVFPYCLQQYLLAHPATLTLFVAVDFAAAVAAAAAAAAAAATAAAAAATARVKSAVNKGAWNGGLSGDSAHFHLTSYLYERIQQAGAGTFE